MNPPVARAQMLIRRPVGEVFKAFVDPAITRRFWFSRGSGRLAPGATVTWHWDRYGVSAQVEVTAFEAGRPPPGGLGGPGGLTVRPDPWPGRFGLPSGLEGGAPMNLDTRLLAFDRERRALLADLVKLAPVQLEATPSPGRWSILQIVEHLVRAERVVFQGLPSASDRKERAPRWKHRLRYLLVRAVLATGLPVRVPAPAMLPIGGGDLAHWLRLWDENQAWLRDYHASRAGDSSRTTALRHPVAGPISIAQAVRLGQLHLRTHTRQIQALLRAQA